MKTLADYREVMRRCVKCGACQAKCPTYRLTRREGAVARGKVALALALVDKEISIENALLRDMDFCLMCGSCLTACPNNIPTPEIVAAARREISGQRGLSPLARGLSFITSSPRVLSLAAKIAANSAFARVAAEKIPAISGLRLRFPKEMAGRILPEIPRRNLFARLPERLPGQAGKAIIGFFAGCGLTYLYPHIGEMAARLLHRLGYSLIIPRNQGCCGIPALSCGDGATADALAARNAAAFAEFAEVDVIVTACASCFSGLRGYDGQCGGKTAEADFYRKVIEFSQFLAREELARLVALHQKSAGQATKARRVTWHDPCHLKSHGLTAPPRQILAALPGLKFREAEGANLCCGLGGSFSLKHYAASQAIGAAKIEGLRASGADLVVTACPGCLAQLQDSISQAGLNMRAVHLAEIALPEI
ncbi:MAG: (Fe-S)-binding protein [Desulfobulbaceae bacterium]|jgi:glycolate oxidase iron-sulfur subunit|nr:(Fe-S)-binding protein [Desulfobulbaceae bacterium]